jgi:hypothetical protein
VELRLNEEEIYEILAEVLAKKSSYVLGEILVQDCWFEVRVEEEPDVNVSGISFCWDVLD